MSRMWLIGAGTALAVLLVASIVIAVVRKPEALPEGTPGRTVQLYLEAVSDDDFEAAYSLLSAELRLRCPIENMVSRRYAKERLGDSRVTLKETTFISDRAIVIANVGTIRGNGPFGTSARTYEQSYTLAEEAGEWRFVNEPWPYHGCAGPTRVGPVVLSPTATPVPTDDASTSTSSN